MYFGSIPYLQRISISFNGACWTSIKDMKTDSCIYEISDNQIKITSMREIAYGQKCGKV